MIYLVKASAVLSIFYLCYYLFLARETFFHSNRWFLIMGLVSTVLLPILNIPIYVDASPIFLDGFPTPVATPHNTPEIFSVTSLIIWIYITGVSLFFIRLLIQFISLGKLLQKEKKQKNDGLTYVETTRDTTPFSFFRWIVYNPELFNSQELKLILEHEKVHAKQMHSVDVLLMELMTILFYFHPLVWLYRKALKQNLEFIADHETQKQIGKDQQYQKLLLKTSLPQPHFIPINTFYNSTIKNRILMLQKPKSKLMNSWKYTIIIPLLAIFMVTFNTKTIAQTRDPSSASTAEDQQNILTFSVTKNTKDAQLDLITTKLAEKDATISFKNVKRNSKDEITAIKIGYAYNGHKGNHHAKSSTPVAPIEISFNPSNGVLNVGQHVSDLSQAFELKSTDNGQFSIPNETTHLFKDAEQAPLIIVDGKEMPNQTVKTIDQNTIASVFVLKDEKATNKYGDKGKNGVVVISLKEGSKTTAKRSTPMYILNGQEITAQEMEAIQPSSIGAIDVLKDKKATAEYGEKGKNGVIIITLKEN